MKLRGRQKVAEYLGESALRHRLMQLILGYKISNGTVIDEYLGFPLEYDFDSVIGRALFFSGYFEELEIRFFEQRLAKSTGLVVLDVGANIGLHALRWARVQPRGHVFAFEPSPRTSALLERNMRTSAPADNITIVREAVSSYCGKSAFYECDDNAFSSLKDTHRKKVVATTTVSVDTIDAFVSRQKLSTVSLIKIDVEGVEQQVIDGARETLKYLKPDLFVEIYKGEASNSDPEATVRYVQSLGYSAYVLVEGRPVPYTMHNDRNYNYFFTFGSI
jgi:FkbM family methyltransferase